MSQFGNYLWTLLNRPFKQRSPENEKWVFTLGESLDQVKSIIFLLRRSWIIGTATSSAIDAHGADRRFARYPGERDNYYRRRVQAAFEIYQRGGTNEGIKKTLAMLGYPDTEIFEIITERARHDGLRRYNRTAKHGGSHCRWAEFDIILRLEPGRQFSPTDLGVLIDTIYRVKSAHAMPRYLIIENSLFRHRHNGQHRYTREIQHNAQVLLQPYHDIAAGKITLQIKS